MNKNLTIIIVLIALMYDSISAQTDSKKIRVNDKEEISFSRVNMNIEPQDCPFTLEPNHVYVPYKGPQHYGISRMSERVALSNIDVSYQDFPHQEAIDAFEFVVSILEEVIPSGQTINISAAFQDLSGGTLANANATDFFFINGPSFPTSTIYPTALAEKILDTSLNNAQRPFDIQVRINQNQNWYYDFNNPGGIGNNFDFVTVVMHEIFHGLGYLSLSNVSGNIGTLTLQGSRNIYDFFLETGDGVNLVEEITNGSTEMGTALRSDDLFFNSGYFRTFTPNDVPKLYAPASFDRGSSTSHIDEDTYSGTANGLMTPSAAPAEITHDPGISLQMLYDIGWSDTRVEFALQTDLAILATDLDQDATFAVQVAHDFGYDTSQLRLFYFEGSFNLLNLRSVQMTPTNQEDIFLVNIPAPGRAAEVNFYFSVLDDRGIRKTNPFGAPNRFFTINWGPDELGPTIAHQTISPITELQKTIPVSATITDARSDVKEASVIYRVEGKFIDTIAMDTMTTEFGLRYVAEMIIPVDLDPTDVLEYRFVASDASPQENVTALPSDGSYFQVSVEDVPDAIAFYSNDFNEATDDFFGDGFSITRPSDAFTSAAIHSTHPYGDAQSLGLQSFDLTYQLVNPIIVSATNPTISFDEIVLVEPGDAGTVFGSSNFWDYVIVEAQSSEGVDWIPLIDGYDSRSNAEWLQAYNNGLSANGQVSSTDGTEELYVNRTIDITESGDFEAGDVINIRFRLFSDPLSFGWGWAIDNLRIQTDNATSITNHIDGIDRFSVFPNPSSNGNVNIEIEATTLKHDLRIEIFDVKGSSVLQESLDVPVGFSRRDINVENLSSGTYILGIFDGKGGLIEKLIIR